MLRGFAIFILVSSLFAAFPTLISAAGSAAVLKIPRIGELARIVAQADIVAAIRASNPVTGCLSAHQTAAADPGWQGEPGQAEMANATRIIGPAASDQLREKVDRSNARITGIFPLDVRGLTAAASGATLDFWHGEGAGFAKSPGKAPGFGRIGRIGFDGSTRTGTARVSASVLDPDSGPPIGASTSRVNAEFLT